MSITSKNNRYSHVFIRSKVVDIIEVQNYFLIIKFIIIIF